MPGAADWGLLLVAQGRVGTPYAAEHAAAIRRRGLFARVVEAYVGDESGLERALRDVRVPRVYVVPLLAAPGHLFDEMIPRRLGLTGRATDRIGRSGRQRIDYCDPVGTHPGIGKAMVAGVRSILRRHGLAAAEVAVLVVGHGTRRNRAGVEETRVLARRIGSCLPGVETASGFLDDEPAIEDWRRLTTRTHVIVLPNLMSQGRHAMEDVPRRLGLGAVDRVRARHVMAGRPQGPLRLGRRRLWLSAPVGGESIIPEIVVERVLERARPVERWPVFGSSPAAAVNAS